LKGILQLRNSEAYSISAGICVDFSMRYIHSKRAW
jgi:hypothetical protein